eukprot:3511239-Prymnesium_polylepis.2
MPPRPQRRRACAAVRGRARARRSRGPATRGCAARVRCAAARPWGRRELAATLCRKIAAMARASHQLR